MIYSRLISHGFSRISQVILGPLPAFLLLRLIRNFLVLESENIGEGPVSPSFKDGTGFFFVRALNDELLPWISADSWKTSIKIETSDKQQNAPRGPFQPVETAWHQGALPTQQKHKPLVSSNWWVTINPSATFTINNQPNVGKHIPGSLTTTFYRVVYLWTTISKVRVLHHHHHHHQDYQDYHHHHHPKRTTIFESVVDFQGYHTCMVWVRLGHDSFPISRLKIRRFLKAEIARAWSVTPIQAKL